MNKKILILGLVMTLMFSMASVVSAKSAVWTNRAYDFGKLHSIYIDTENLEYDAEVKVPEISELAAKENLYKQERMIKAYRVLDTPEAADAVVKLKFLEWGKASHRVPDERKIEYKNVVEIDHEGKKTTVTVPVETVIPGYVYTTNYFSVKYTLVDKDGTKLLEYIDSRDDAKRHNDMFRRATKDFYRQLNKLPNVKKLL